MSSITLKIPDNKFSKIKKQELETLLSEFIYEYIETQEDLELRQDLSKDKQFISLNRKLESKLWNL